MKAKCRKNPELGFRLSSDREEVDGRKHVNLEVPIYIPSTCSVSCLEMMTVRLTVRVFDPKSGQMIKERSTPEFMPLQQRSVFINALLSHDTVYYSKTPTFKLEATAQLLWNHEPTSFSEEVDGDSLVVVNPKKKT